MGADGHPCVRGLRPDGNGRRGDDQRPRPPAPPPRGGAPITARARQRLGSAGRPMPGVMVRCAEDGEILVGGPTVSRGYFGDPALTESAFTDGWLRSGGVGRWDEEGFLYVIGRMSSRIVLPDGRKVYPEDVEQDDAGAHPSDDVQESI